MYLLAAILFSWLSTEIVSRLCNAIPGRHHSDFHPDYPGGLAGLSWLILNVAVWSLAIATTF